MNAPHTSHPDGIVEPHDVAHNQKRRRLYHWRPILILALAGVALMLPAIIYGIPVGADLMNHYRHALPFYDSIQSGTFYPGWLAESNYGLGDPRFRFYPPGLYYLLALFRFVTGSWHASTLAACTLLMFLSGLGAYFWARTHLAQKWALGAGLIYLIAPYHLNEFYQASLLSEFAASAVLPFAFGFVDRVCGREARARDVAGLAVSLALLILTHLPLTLIGGLALAVYTLASLSRANLWREILKLALGIALALIASAFFWVTMISELSWIQAGAGESNSYYDYRLNFLFAPDALTNRNTWYANLLALASIGFFLPALALVLRAARKHFSRSLRALSVTFCFSFLMATPLSRPVWALVPRLGSVQFPWRWLALASMCGAILLAASLPFWFSLTRAQLRPLFLVPLLGLTLALFFSATQIVYESEFMTRAALNATLPQVRGTESFKDWLPVWARPVAQVSKMSHEVEAGGREVRVTQWEPQRRAFEVAAGAAAEVRVRTYYYPRWKAASGEQPLATRPDADGLLVIEIPPDATSVTLEFQEPARARLAAGLSACGWLIIAGLLSFGLRKGSAHEYHQAAT